MRKRFELLRQEASRGMDRGAGRGLRPSSSAATPVLEKRMEVAGHGIRTSRQPKPLLPQRVE